MLSSESMTWPEVRLLTWLLAPFLVGGMRQTHRSVALSTPVRGGSAGTPMHSPVGHHEGSSALAASVKSHPASVGIEMKSANAAYRAPRRAAPDRPLTVRPLVAGPIDYS